jgi:undecaprenyl-diphosphatase
MATGFVIVATVGVGRVALNVHHLSDVVAGWALGYAYFAACLLILRGAPVTATDEIPAVPDSGR